EALTDPDSASRRKAALMLASLEARSATAIPALLKMLRHDAEALNRAAAAAALGEIGAGLEDSSAGQAEMARTLIAAWKHDKDKNVKARAAHALIPFRTVLKEVLPDLRALLRDPDLDIVAILALARIGPAAVPVLVEALLEDKSELQAT